MNFVRTDIDDLAYVPEGFYDLVEEVDVNELYYSDVPVCGRLKKGKYFFEVRYTYDYFNPSNYPVDVIDVHVFLPRYFEVID